MRLSKIEKLTWLRDEARRFLDSGYIQNQTAEERYNDIADRLGEISGIPGFAEKWKFYINEGFTTFASPIISNLGKNTGLPASCNFLKIQDTMESISSSEHEMTMLASNGAGTARNYSLIRPIGHKYGVNGKSEGVMSWIEQHAKKIYKISQGGTRRGFLTAYLSVQHEEIMDFLTIGREGSDIKRITTGVTIPKGWMESLIEGDEEKWKIWVEIHESRAEKGFPYILFEDNANKGKHQVYVDKGFWLDTSNICTETIEWTDEFKEFLCVLLSVNATKWDKWKDTDFIFDCNIALDCVITEYIEKARHIPGHEKAVRFAEEHRSIGIGIYGFHTLLQQMSIVFGSIESLALNDEIFSYIRSESDRASKWMAKEWGEPLMLKGYGDRNTSRLAQAPTKSTSNLIDEGISEGINVIDSNYNSKDLAKTQTEWKNPNLIPVLQKYGKDTEEVWDNILEHGGSVQQLDFLTQHERDVFRIGTEISQMDVLELAAGRQPYIDQAQSLNLTIPKHADAEDVMSLTIEAWLKGLKTLYYQHNVNSAQEATKNLLTCSTCEA